MVSEKKSLPPTGDNAGEGGDGQAKKPDPFNPASLRLTQDFLAVGGVQRHVTTVPVRKPSREEWVRVRPEPEYLLDTLVLELKDSREMYLITPALWGELSTESTVSPRRLHTAINRQGVLFLWPLKLPATDGRLDNWSESALEAAGQAKTEWVRVKANMSLGAYEFGTPRGTVSPPEGPQMAFQEALRLAFRNCYIDSAEHVVLRRLRGEV